MAIDLIEIRRDRLLIDKSQGWPRSRDRSRQRSYNTNIIDVSMKVVTSQKNVTAIKGTNQDKLTKAAIDMNVVIDMSQDLVIDAKNDHTKTGERLTMGHQGMKTFINPGKIFPMK